MIDYYVKTLFTHLTYIHNLDTFPYKWYIPVYTQSIHIISNVLVIDWPVMYIQGFDVLLVVNIAKLLNKQSRLEMQWCSCDVTVMHVQLESPLHRGHIYLKVRHWVKYQLSKYSNETNKNAFKLIVNTIIAILVSMRKPWALWLSQALSLSWPDALDKSCESQEQV